MTAERFSAGMRSDGEREAGRGKRGEGRGERKKPGWDAGSGTRRVSESKGEKVERRK